MRAKIAILLAALFAVVSQVQSAPIPLEPPAKDGKGKVWTKQQVEDARASGNLFKPATELYRAGEFQADVFGSATVQELTSDGLKDHDAGFGIGFNYFFSRNIGLGLETRNIISTSEDSFNHVGLNLFARFPIGRVAPYAIAGAGTRYQDHEVRWRLYGGAGIEFRLHPNVGVFTDLRLVQKDFESVASAGYVGRAGIRISY